jgi:hypothetical protein
MSGIQGWPGAGAAPGPARGGSGGQRVGILLLAIVMAVAASFGLALATGADSRDTEAMAPPQLPGGLDAGLEGGLDAGLDGGPDGGLDVGDLGGLQTPGLDDFETPDAGLTGGSGSGSGSGGIDAPTQTPRPDPTLESYQEVAAGDCLANWMVDETSWVSDLPEAVDCDADNAGLWVSRTSDSTAACDTDAGRSYLSYSSAEGDTVALCVTRQFEVGQCFLGESDNSANLMSWVDCEAPSVPSPYTQLFNVTGVYSAPANPEGTECARVAGDTTQYWWWTMDGDSVMLCAVVYSS